MPTTKGRRKPVRRPGGGRRRGTNRKPRSFSSNPTRKKGRRPGRRKGNRPPRRKGCSSRARKRDRKKCRRERRGDGRGQHRRKPKRRRGKRTISEQAVPSGMPTGMRNSRGMGRDGYDDMYGRTDISPGDIFRQYFNGNTTHCLTSLFETAHLRNAPLLYVMLRVCVVIV